MLSKRGQEQVPSNAFNEMWEVMKDPWDRHSNPTGAVNLGVAENHLMEAELRDFVAKHVALRSSVVTYQDGPMGSHRLREALAQFLSRHLATHRPLDAAHIMVTNGVSSALEHVAWALADPGEAFLLGRPYYGEITLRLRPHVRTVPASFGGVDPLSLPAVRCYEEALLRAREQGQVVRGLLLCSPHNPLGRCYPREVLVALAALCNKYQLHLVSDEVYALSVWRDEPAFTSVLALDLDSLIDPALVHVLWGVSKDFGANGWRVGCLVSPRNPALRAALSSIAIYSYASSLADAVVTQLLLDDAFTSAYLAENRRRLAAAYAFTTDFLQHHGIPFAAGTQAALFVWADLGWAYRRWHPHSEREQATTVVDDVRDALRRHKVYLASGDNFDSESPDMFRIVFAHPRDRLEEGLRRIHQALLQGSIGVPAAGDQPCAPVGIGMPVALAQTPAVGRRQALAAPASQGRSLLQS